MVKVHEISVDGNKLDKINSSKIYVCDTKNTEIGDFVFFTTSERTLMSKINEIYEDAGLKENFKILKLSEV